MLSFAVSVPPLFTAVLSPLSLIQLVELGIRHSVQWCHEPPEQEDGDIDVPHEVDRVVVLPDAFSVKQQERGQHVGEGLHLAEPEEQASSEAPHNGTPLLHRHLKLFLADDVGCGGDQAEEVARLQPMPNGAQGHCQQRPAGGRWSLPCKAMAVGLHLWDF